MSDLHIFDGFGGSWARLNPADTREMATRFIPAVDGLVRGLRWIRPDTTAAGHPTKLHLWDTTTQAIIGTCDPAPDDGTVGWQEQIFGTPVVVVAGREYRVSGVCPSGSIYPEDGTVGGHTPPSGLAFASTVRAYTNAGATGYPNNTDNAQYEGFDVVFSPGTTPPSDAATVGDVNNQLAAWLSDTDGTHADSTPIKTYQEATSLDHGFAKLAEGLNRVLNQTGDVIAAAGHTVAESWELTLRAFGLHGAPIDSSVSKADGTKAIDVLLDLAPLAGAEGRILALQRDFVPLPGTGWELQDETDFTREIAWAVPADAYVLTVTDYPIVHDEIDVGGVTWLPRLGWWAALNGTQGRDRRFINFSESQLDEWPRRLPGVVIRLDAQVEAHLQAWTFTPAS